MTSPKILDNSAIEFRLKTFLEQNLISGNYSQVSIATGYWDLPAIVELLPSLKEFLNSKTKSNIRLLIGEEPTIRTFQLEKSFPEKYLTKDLKELPFKFEFKQAVDFIIESIEAERLQVKLYKKDFLHAKCYILGSDTEKAIGIIGSSNFTRNGLLGNTELNDVEYDHRIVNYLPKGADLDPSHRSWFEKLWIDEESLDWNQNFKIDILGLSQFGELAYSPYEMYIRILYEIYGEDIEIEEKLKAEERFESNVDLTMFQEESFRKVMNRLNNDKIGMCLVGDSVGLGKSYIAKRVIEDIGYFKRKNVVIICPASLRDDWKKHLQDVTVNAPVYSITEFGMETSLIKVKSDLSYRKDVSKSENAIDLLVIDESHNLKTQGSQSFQNLLQILTDENFCKTLPRVLMLSATPVNNGIKDLANQILLAKGGNEKFFSHFGIESIPSLFGNTQKEFIKRDTEEVFAELYPLLNKIMVKRTKHQVKKDFPDALLDGKPIIFPEEKLENINYELDNKELRKSISTVIHGLEKSNEELFTYFTADLKEEDELQEEKEGIAVFFNYAEKKKLKKLKKFEFESVFHFVDRAIKGLKLIPYSYLNEKIDKSAEEEIQANARKNLTGVMKVTMFKSFDSSIFTFKKRIEKYETYLKNFEGLFFQHKKIVKPIIIQKAIERQEERQDEDLLDIIFEEIEAFEKREEKKKENDRNYKIQKAYAEISLEDYHIDKIKNCIKQDKDIIDLVYRVLGHVKVDTKFEALLSRLKVLKGNKVLVFSYFATTIDYLKSKLSKEFLEELGINEKQTAFIKSKNGKEKQGIVQRFSPIAQRQQITDGKINGQPEIHLLFSTDVLSEGQNLQDCGIIINYDLHWNPVKMIQRNGRINRLGSRFEKVHIYNFCPDTLLDKFLKLLKKLQVKIRIIGYSVGIDSSILGEEITDKQFGLIDSIYSDDKERQKNAIEELERQNDLAFDEVFENDLREFMRKANDDEKEKILNMNFNKWCGLLTIKDNDKMLVFNIGKGEFEFIKTSSGKFAKETNQLKSLQTIRSFDVTRKNERLSYEEKSELIEHCMRIFETDRAYQSTIDDSDLSEFMGVKGSGGNGSLNKAKQELIKLLNENTDRFSTDNYNRMIKIITTKNLAFESRLRNYLKKSDYLVSVDFLDNLALLSTTLIKKEIVTELPNPVIWFGYYSNIE